MNLRHRGENYHEDAANADVGIEVLSVNLHELHGEKMTLFGKITDSPSAQCAARLTGVRGGGRLPAHHARDS